MFQRLFGRERANRAIVDGLYDSIVAAARQPVLYSELGVPDTPLGRFEMISLHLALALRRLRVEEGAEVAQEIVDKFFLEVDHSLRELGIGDTSVPKRARKLAKMFYGRIGAYDPSIDARSTDELASALARNVRPDLKEWPGADLLAAYALEAERSIAAQSLDSILSGSIDFPSAGNARPHAA